MSKQPFNTMSEDEISLKDIIDFLIESWKKIVLGGIAGGLLGLGYLVIAPAKYQATASIQVAKVAGIDVEAPALLVEKLKMPMYYSQKTYVACNLMDKHESGEVIAKTLKPILTKSAPIITISYREKSREGAQKCLESVLDDVRSNQSLLAKPIFESKANQLLNLKLKLESAEKLVKILDKNNFSYDFSDSKFSASALLLATTISKESEIKDLRATISDLEITLVEPLTKETFLVTPIYAPHFRESSTSPTVLAASFFGGLFLALIFMMGQRGYRAYKLSNQQ
jgi:hypothetical protein